ncbi:hypothetical protein BH09BAC6_BH09BAC6_04400 [soil metagenome]
MLTPKIKFSYKGAFIGAVIGASIGLGMLNYSLFFELGAITAVIFGYRGSMQIDQKIPRPLN